MQGRKTTAAHVRFQNNPTLPRLINVNFSLSPADDKRHITTSLNGVKNVFAFVAFDTDAKISIHRRVPLGALKAPASSAGTPWGGWQFRGSLEFLPHSGVFQCNELCVIRQGNRINPRTLHPSQLLMHPIRVLFNKISTTAN